MAKQPLNPVIEQMVFINCLQCKRPITRGYYGPHQGGGTCCLDCETIYDKREKFPGYTEADYLKRQGENHAT